MFFQRIQRFQYIFFYLFQKDWIPCQYCPDAYPSRKQSKSHEWYAHIKAYLKRPKHPFACQDCKLVIDKSRQVQHRRHKHPELKDGWTHCKHCKLVFRCDAQLKDHLDQDSRCNSQYSEEDLMKIHTNVIQSKKVHNTQPESETQTKRTDANNVPNVTFTYAPIVLERQPDHPDSSSTPDDCKVVAIKKSSKKESRLRKRLEQEDHSSVPTKSARPSSPEITVISESLVNSRNQESLVESLDSFQQIPPNQNLVITKVNSKLKIRLEDFSKSTPPAPHHPGEPLNLSSQSSILRQRLEVESNKPEPSSSSNPDSGSRLGTILKQNLNQKLQENQSKRTFVKIAPKPSNTENDHVKDPFLHHILNSTSTNICQRCHSQFQLFEDINQEVAALKPAANQFVLMECVHAVMASWSQCNNCSKAYPHDFKIDSRHRLKDGIHDVNLDDIDTNLPFLGILTPP